ncbi:cupin domain-containing protein [Maritalea porphyrae]|jgi:transcriptional regulator with XRE-family HTH domain|uniref:cupin domain-containing protein n=1 Tax=Maritalea porphyrae TaxID=880732 RepID=UPI0022AED202|nr:cupin domain-containing protein [Maritalea porphyrae]MCZ4272648.1 cupin domain-containing protein [Maritalea porphyrae]
MINADLDQRSEFFAAEVEEKPVHHSGTPLVGGLIRERRRGMNMTLKELGELANLSVGFLSQVERDQATPSLGALSMISKGLDVEMEFFVSSPAVHRGRTRQGERESFSVDDSSLRYERLGADFAGKALSSFIITVPAGYKSERVSHEGEEIIYILEGEVVTYVENEKVILSAGDSLHFRSTRTHSWENVSDAICRILWTGTVPIFRNGASAK